MKANISIKLLLLIGFVALPSACNQYDPFNPDTANLKGVWAIDNTHSRKASERPILKRLTIYATHMEFCPGQGTYGTQGQWRSDGFWCMAKDGSGEFEAAKLLNAEEIELHLAAFYSGNAEILTLYKQRGGDDEMKALAAKYPQPVSYPPPQGVISVGMTEYQLTTLPWKPDKLMPSLGDDKADDATIYNYHSDNPSLMELRVTVRNHRVIGIGGGNG